MAAPPHDPYLGFTLAEQVLAGEAAPLGREPQFGSYGDRSHEVSTQYMHYAVGDMDTHNLARVHMLLTLMEGAKRSPVSMYKRCVERMLQTNEVIGLKGQVMQDTGPPKPLPAPLPNRRLDVIKNCWVQPVKDSPPERVTESQPQVALLQQEMAQETESLACCGEEPTPNVNNEDETKPDAGCGWDDDDVPGPFDPNMSEQWKNAYWKARGWSGGALGMDSPEPWQVEAAKLKLAQIEDSCSNVEEE